MIFNNGMFVDVISGMRGVFSKGDFHLSKFISNCHSILRDVPEADRADSKETNIDGSGDEQSVLGVKWSTDSDSFSFSCKIPPSTTTLLVEICYLTLQEFMTRLDSLLRLVYPSKLLCNRSRSSVGTNMMRQ